MMGLLFFAKRVVWFFWDNPRYLVMLLAFIILVLIGMQIKGCFTRTPKFNEDEIRRAQKAIAEDNRKEMVEVLAQSEVREKNIDANVANAKVETVNAYTEARKKYSEMSNDDLARELEARK